MKKHLLRLTMITLFALLAAGCGVQSTPPPGPIGPQPGNVQPQNPNPDGLQQPGGPQSGGPQQPPAPQGDPGGPPGVTKNPDIDSYTDLALSDIYLVEDVPFFTIKNVGTAVWPDQAVTVTCNGYYTEASGRVEFTPATTMVPPAVIRELGTAADMEVGYSLDPRMTAMFVECSIDPTPLDSNPVNDRCGPVKLK